MSWISRGEHDIRTISGEKIVRQIRFNACSPVLGFPGSLALAGDDCGDGSMKQVRKPQRVFAVIETHLVSFRTSPRDRAA